MKLKPCKDRGFCMKRLSWFCLLIQNLGVTFLWFLENVQKGFWLVVFFSTNGVKVFTMCLGVTPPVPNKVLCTQWALNTLLLLMLRTGSWQYLQIRSFFLWTHNLPKFYEAWLDTLWLFQNPCLKGSEHNVNHLELNWGHGMLLLGTMTVLSSALFPNYLKPIGSGGLSSTD